MDRNKDVIQTHPLIGWDISTVDSYDAMMIRLHSLSSNEQQAEDAEVGQTYWLTTDVARQFISLNRSEKGTHRVPFSCPSVLLSSPEH